MNEAWAIHVGKLLRRGAERNPGKVAIIWEEGTRTYGDLLRRVDRLSAGLAARGVQPGDRVGVLFPNGPHFLEGLVGRRPDGRRRRAAQHPRAAARAVVYVLNDAEAVAVLVDAEFLRRSMDMRRDVPSLRLVVGPGRAAAARASCPSRRWPRGPPSRAPGRRADLRRSLRDLLHRRHDGHLEGRRALAPQRHLGAGAARRPHPAERGLPGARPDVPHRRLADGPLRRAGRRAPRWSACAASTRARCSAPSSATADAASTSTPCWSPTRCSTSWRTTATISRRYVTSSGRLGRCPEAMRARLLDAFPGLPFEVTYGMTEVSNIASYEYSGWPAEGRELRRPRPGGHGAAHRGRRTTSRCPPSVWARWLSARRRR